MTTLQEAARDALEALERIGKDFVCRSAHHAKKDQHSAFAECPVVVRHTDAIESLKAALAQQDDTVTALRSQVEYLEKIVEDQAKALAQHGEQAKPAAYITDTEQGPMVWTPEMYDEACTYCDDGEFPVPLYTAAPAPQAQERSTCNHCDGTGWVVRDPDIGTDQECFVCDGSGYVKEEPAPQAQPDWLLKTTQDLANSIRRRCFPEVPQFQVLDDLAGVISQIDNMTCGMERKSAPQAQDKSDNYLSGYCTGRTDLLKEQSAQPVAQPLAKTCDTCAHYQQGKHPGVSIYDETCYICREYYANKWEAKSE